MRLRGAPIRVTVLRRFRLRPLLLTLFLAMLGAALAQACLEEVEPNDEPAQAPEFSQAVCLTGVLEGNDQDSFMWELSEEDAGYPWSLEIEGIPGQLTQVELYRITFADNGVDVTRAQNLWGLATGNGQPVRSEPFLLAPGSYLVGVSKSGGEGRWVVSMHRGRELTGAYRRMGQQEGASGELAFSGNLDGQAEIAWELAEEDANYRWGLELFTSFLSQPELVLEGPAGGAIVRGRVDNGGRLRLDGLGLEAGNYRLLLEGDGEPVPFAVSASRQGRLTDGNEVEPNNNRDSANLLDFERPLQAFGGDDDFFAFTVDGERASSAWDLLIESEMDLRVRLYTSDNEQLFDARGWGGRLEDLVFDEGTFFLLIDPRDQGEYSLSFEEAERPREGFEHEPNNTVAGAHPLNGSFTTRGTLSGSDTDVFSFEVEGEPQLWRVQVLGDGVEELRSLNGGGIEQQSASGERRIRMDNLLLLPGTHFLEVSGEGGEYALRAIPLGPPPEPESTAVAPAAEARSEPGTVAAGEAAAGEAADAEEETAGAEEADIETPTVEDDDAAELGTPPPGRMELEPNGDQSRAELLRFGETRVGTLSQDSDRDYYRFFLANDQYVRFEIHEPEGGRVRLASDGIGRTYSAEGGGNRLATEHWLPAGDHFVTVTSEEWAEGYYQLELSSLDPLALPPDSEPNDQRDTAVTVPAGLAWQGSVGERRDWDYYLIPPFERETEMEFSFETDDSAGFRLERQEGGLLKPEQGEDGAWRTTLPAQERTYFAVNGRGDYRVVLEFSEEPAFAELRPQVLNRDLDLALSSPHREFAAYWHEGQRVEALLEVSNSSSTAQSLQLFATTSDADVTVSLPPSVRLAAGESRRIPIEVVALPDIRDDQPVQVTVAALVDGEIASSQLELAPLCDAPPVSPQAMWRTPEPLLGKLNVLWNAFDLTITSSESGYTETLFDGVTAPSSGLRSSRGETVTVELPGGEPVALAGAMLHPQSIGNTSSQLREFEIEVSLDGEQFTSVLAGELRSARVEQSFLFDRPVQARFARLRLKGSHGGRSSIRLGEWKLIAAEDSPMGELNLADPVLGGHVVWSAPLLRDRGLALLDEETDHRALDVEDLEEMEFVVGFHHSRAAQVARIEWLESSEAATGELIDRLTVEVSMQGAAGPWQPLSDWELERDSSGRAVLALDGAVWARYLRFSTAVPQDTERLRPPGTLRIIEREAGPEYLSALGQWDHYRKDAWFELQAQDSLPATFERDDNDSMEGAQAIEAEESVSGAVAVAEDVDWYRVTVEESENELILQLQGDPSIAYLYELYDSAGEKVFYQSSDQNGVVQLSAFVDPGDYFLKLEEPKRSVIFSWDTSGSVGPYQPITYNSLARFARGLDAKREATQLLAFDQPAPVWLLPYWSEEPLRVQRAINEFDRKPNSSNSELALYTATEALDGREGTRAVLFMTDAETNGYGLTADLWKRLGEVKPRVFTFEISTAGSNWTQDMMQDWSAVNGGFYDYTRNIGDFDVGFARASCHLRRPKRYKVVADARYQEPPGPGRLSVRRPEGASLPAVQVIFDASGSMGSRLESGEQKIEVAKQVLEELVTEILPQGTPFALRAFGHIAPTSCETQLDVPLAPLDSAVAANAIAAIEPKLLSQTPIADSLLAVPEDLANAGSGSTIILITDGEESCDGDPAAALTHLREQGFDVRLSVVSLGVDDDAVKERFAALAQQGGGQYVDARDAQLLRDSVEAALYPVFEVLNSDGEVVATGLVDGDPIELEMGIYRVRLPSDASATGQEVRVPGDDAVTIEIAEP